MEYIANFIKYMTDPKDELFEALSKSVHEAIAEVLGKSYLSIRLMNLIINKFEKKAKITTERLNDEANRLKIERKMLGKNIKN